MWLCCIPDRAEKTERLMRALKAGIPVHTDLCWDVPPDDGRPVVVWGHLWTSPAIVQQCERSGTPYWFIDNGFWSSARGGPSGYYRMTYRGLHAQFLRNMQPRLDREQMEWRTRGDHVLLALPGEHYGEAHGINIWDWTLEIRPKIRQHTSRLIKVRSKNRSPLVEDLRNAWCLVTHSSNVAVEAARYGTPVFVEPGASAEPIGSTDLSRIEDPHLPDMATRMEWWRSLMCQQFTISEMAAGVAWRYMEIIRRHADGPDVHPRPDRFDLQDPASAGGAIGEWSQLPG